MKRKQLNARFFSYYNVLPLNSLINVEVLIKLKNNRPKMSLEQLVWSHIKDK